MGYLLLGEPTWLWSRYGKHNSPPVSLFLDLLVCCSACPHVPVDAIHPYLLRSSSLSSPRWYHLQSFILFVSPLDMPKPPQTCYPVHLCAVVYFKSLPDVFLCHKVSYGVAACSSAHVHFCHMQFFHVGASHWHRLHPVQHSWHEQSSCGPLPSRVVTLSCRIGRMASLSSYSVHNGPSRLLRYSYHHHSAGCFPDI